MSDVGGSLGANGESSPTVEQVSGRRRSDRVVGAARSTQELIDQAMAVARSDRPVLITGPAGVGKGPMSKASTPMEQTPLAKAISNM